MSYIKNDSPCPVQYEIPEGTRAALRAPHGAPGPAMLVRRMLARACAACGHGAVDRGRRAEARAGGGMRRIFAINAREAATSGRMQGTDAFHRVVCSWFDYLTDI